MTFPGYRLSGDLTEKPIGRRTSKRKREEYTTINFPSFYHRLTLMVGFWIEDVSKIGERQPYGACSSIPRSSRSLKWVELLESGVCALNSSSSSSSSCSNIISPIKLKLPKYNEMWEFIDENKTARSNLGSSSSIVVVVVVV